MTYGVGDASYLAAGGLEGLQRLTHDFYALMEQLPEAAQLRSLHGEDLSISQDKLACFLSGWLGGPKLFSEKYGPISIPAFHSRWPISEELSQSWLNCMAKAIARQPFAPDFAEYLLAQLRVPAQRSVEASRNRHGG